MFDKSFTIQLVNQVLKEEIIPSLDSGVAKEQAIAMVSVLKNVDLNSEQNLHAYIEANELLQRELTRILNLLKEASIDEVSDELQIDVIQLQHVKSIKNIKNKREELNALLSRVLKKLYKKPEETKAYIKECRKLLRKQLDIEMSLVG